MSIEQVTIGMNMSNLDTCANKTQLQAEIMIGSPQMSPKQTMGKKGKGGDNFMDKNDVTSETNDFSNDVSTREKTHEKAGELDPKQKFTKQAKSKTKWDDSPPAQKGRANKEAEESEDDFNSDHESSEIDDEIHSLNGEVIEEITEGTTQQKEGQTKIEQDNVLDLVSFHSKYSKNVFETASVNKSVKGSVLSKKHKGQL